VTDFEELHQESILDHSRNPRNTASLDHIPKELVHENPSCGDSLKLEVTIDGSGKIEKVVFDGKGCAISTASASLMTETVIGLPKAESRRLAGIFIDALRGKGEPGALDAMGDLAAFKGVIRFPMRVKCASLAWHALLATLPDAG